MYPLGHCPYCLQPKKKKVTSIFHRINIKGFIGSEAEAVFLETQRRFSFFFLSFSTYKIQAEIQKSDSNPFPRTVRRIMGRSCFLRALFLSALLLLSSSHGGYCYCQLIYYCFQYLFFPSMNLLFWLVLSFL